MMKVSVQCEGYSHNDRDAGQTSGLGGGGGVRLGLSAQTGAGCLARLGLCMSGDRLTLGPKKKLFYQLLDIQKFFHQPPMHLITQS